jgi:hypothetical protein
VITLATASEYEAAITATRAGSATSTQEALMATLSKEQGERGNRARAALAGKPASDGKGILGI